MSEIDLEQLRTWIGKTHTDEDLISARHARLMAATVDYFSAERIRDGEDLPPVRLPKFSRTCTPTTTTLFRHSALTYNGHRIPCDADYCRAVEGYPDLLIHGPLIATMLASYAEAVSGRRLRDFSYRGLSPALPGDSIGLQANMTGERVALHAALDNGTACRQAEAVPG